MAEKWTCSASLVPFGQEGVEIKIYERSGNSFKKTSKYGSSYFQILKENEKFIILVETYPYASLFVTILSKKDNTFSEDYLGDKSFLGPDGNSKPQITMRGQCLVS